MRDCNFEIISNKNIKLETYSQSNFLYLIQTVTFTIIAVKSYKTEQVNFCLTEQSYSTILLLYVLIKFKT